MPIREKFDLIKLLVHTVKYILTEPINPADIPCNRELILYVDRMSRVFFCIEEKIISFHFPFYITESEETPGYLDIMLAPDIQIDSIYSSILLALFNDEGIFSGDLDTVSFKIIEEVQENEWPVSEDFLLYIVQFLMLFEPGYLRYDHDVEHSNGLFHPEHHIDLYYSSNNTFKLGLVDEIQPEWLIDMTNILTECSYIR